MKKLMFCAMIVVLGAAEELARGQLHQPSVALERCAVDGGGGRQGQARADHGGQQGCPSAPSRVLASPAGGAGRR